MEVEIYETEGASGGDIWHGTDEHWTPITEGGVLVLACVERTVRFHSGIGSIDTTAPTLYRDDILTMHAAALIGGSTWTSAASAAYGQWWTSTVAACDTAGLSGVYHVVEAVRRRYVPAVTV